MYRCSSKQNALTIVRDSFRSFACSLARSVVRLLPDRHIAIVEQMLNRYIGMRVPRYTFRNQGPLINYFGTVDAGEFGARSSGNRAGNFLECMQIARRAGVTRPGAPAGQLHAHDERGREREKNRSHGASCSRRNFIPARRHDSFVIRGARKHYIILRLSASAKSKIRGHGELQTESKYRFSYR